MPNTLRIKRRTSGTANGGVPTTSQCVNAELAFNEVNGKLYYGKGGNETASSSVVAIGGENFSLIDGVTAGVPANSKALTLGSTGKVGGFEIVGALNVSSNAGETAASLAVDTYNNSGISLYHGTAGGGGAVRLTYGTAAGGANGDTWVVGSDEEHAGDSRTYDIRWPNQTGRLATLADISSAIASAVGLSSTLKSPVNAATTANITLSGTQTIDGVVLVADDRVLVKDQTTASANGIYVVAAGSWSRATDVDTGAELLGASTFVLQGTANGSKTFVNTNTSAITLGTTAVTFADQSAAAAVVAGAGLTKTGTTIDVVTANSGRIVVNPDSIDLATVGTAGTYTKVTTDAYGRVTSGSAQVAIGTDVSGLGTNVAAFLATPSSANLIAAVTDETGSGALVFGTSPAFTTSVTTGSTTFAVFNTTATTVNAFGAATTLSVGAGTGTTTINNNLTVTGNLTVNGTTTTVNSTTVTVDDPIITLGGDTAPGSDDNKDRGVEFRWHNGTTARIGFFGYDDSAAAFTFIPDATNSSEVFSGTVGDAVFGKVNNVTITSPASAATLTIGSGKTATISNTLTFTGTDASSVAFGAGGTVIYTTSKLNALASTTSAELAGVISDETGSGALVFATSPTLVTPTLGVASATSVNKVAITAPATSATLTIADGKTLTASNTLTFTGTDASSVAFGAGGTVIYTTSKLNALASTTSSELAGVISDETGSGALVFATSPALTTPSLSGETYSTTNNVTAGTNAQGQGAITSNFNVITTAAASPSGVTLPTATQGRRIIIVNRGANAVNVYPATGAAIDGLAANASLQIPVNGGVEFNAASTTQWYSTSSSSIALGSITGLATGVATFLGTPSSANLAAAVTDETGSGALVFATSPTLVTPTLGVASATSVNKVAITAPATSATLTIADGKTLTANNSLTFAGTDATTMTFPSTSATLAGLGIANAFTAANTFTNATGQTFRPAANQDGIIVQGRAGGTSNFAVTLATATLSANRTITFPDAAGTVVTTSTICTDVGNCTLDGGTF